MRTLVLAVLVAFGLACGGFVDEGWNESKAEPFVEMSVQLRGVAASPERTALFGLLDEGYLHARTGDLGIIAISSWRQDFEKAIADKAVSPAELTALQADAAAFSTPVSLDDTVRGELLADKRTAEGVAAERMAAEDTARRQTEADARASHFSKWKLPTDLVDKAVAAKMTVEDCDKYTEKGESWVMCELRGDGSFADVTLDYLRSKQDAEDAAATYAPGMAAARDGKVVLQVEYFDTVGARTLLDTAAPKGTKLYELKRSEVATALKPAGWSMRDCAEDSDRDSVAWDCELVKGKLSGSITLSKMRKRGGYKGENRGVSGGTAELDQGDAFLLINVTDTDAARALLKNLLKARKVKPTPVLPPPEGMQATADEEPRPEPVADDGVTATADEEPRPEPVVDPEPVAAAVPEPTDAVAAARDTGTPKAAPAPARDTGTPMPAPSPQPTTSAPAPAPAPAPKPAPRPSSGGTRINVSGPAKVVLVRRGKRYHVPGKVPSGRYSIEAAFPGKDAFQAGKITVLAGEDKTVACNAAMNVCRVR